MKLKFELMVSHSYRQFYFVEELEEPVKYLSRYGLLRNSGIQNKVRKSLYSSLMKHSLMT
jgi:hypothetical protein